MQNLFSTLDRGVKIQEGTRVFFFDWSKAGCLPKTPRRRDLATLLGTVYAPSSWTIKIWKLSIFFCRSDQKKTCSLWSTVTRTLYSYMSFQPSIYHMERSLKIQFRFPSNSCSCWPKIHHCVLGEIHLYLFVLKAIDFWEPKLSTTGGVWLLCTCMIP